MKIAELICYLGDKTCFFPNFLVWNATERFFKRLVFGIFAKVVFYHKLYLLARKVFNYEDGSQNPVSQSLIHGCVLIARDALSTSP